MSRLPADVKKNITVLFFDTMGVFWTMKYPNTRQEDLLVDWSLTAEGLPITLFTPQGHYQQQKERGIPVDKAFALKTSELSAGDWCNVFDIKLTDPLGIAIERALDVAHTQKRNYDIPDLIATVQKDQKSTKEVKDAVENRLLGAKKWGLFAAEGTTIDELLQPGSVNVLDISTYTNTLGNWSVKGLIIGLISRKLLEERMKARKIEEVAEIQKHKSYFFEDEGQETPMVWIMIDECVTGDTEIITSTNHTKMIDVIKKVEQGEDVCVLTYDTIHKQYLHKKVTKAYRIPHRQVVTLTTETGRNITCTPDHPILTKFGYLSAVSAKELAFPLVQHYSQDKEAIKARLLGYLFGDGWLSKNRTVGFSGKVFKGDLLKIKEDLQKLDLSSSSVQTRATHSQIQSIDGSIAEV